VKVNICEKKSIQFWFKITQMFYSEVRWVVFDYRRKKVKGPLYEISERAECAAWLFAVRWPDGSAAPADVNRTLILVRHRESGSASASTQCGGAHC
jgi:hypothetical protein